MVKPPTQKQRRIIKAKIKGASNKDIGAVEYPNATPGSQAVLVSRELKKGAVAQYLEQSKLQALKEHNITWSRIIRPLNDALEAEKQNNFTGEITPDHNTQMRASKQLAELIQTKDIQNEESAPLMNIPSNLDEIQILRAWKTPPQQD